MQWHGRKKCLWNIVNLIALQSQRASCRIMQFQRTLTVEQEVGGSSPPNCTNKNILLSRFGPFALIVRGGLSRPPIDGAGSRTNDGYRKPLELVVPNRNIQVDILAKPPELRVT